LIGGFGHVPRPAHELHLALSSSGWLIQILGSVVLCALARRIVSPVEIRAGKLSLQPEAIGADQEARR
jgi:hypothetical protein